MKEPSQSAMAAHLALAHRLAPSLAPSVIAWQQSHGRHGLPWQATRDPYRVWMSEVMLQQTQVSTVLRYYAPFLARFPSVAALADAHLDDVLAAWSGLGFYRRARLAHRCAQAVVTQHQGQFPTRQALLQTLPGIGRSTAGAIAAFCFGERAAILDGNVKRVLTRVLAFDEDVQRAASIKRLWDAAETLLPQAQPTQPAVQASHMVAYTQGLMDLGADVCLARNPRCSQCPLASACVALKQGQVHRYPVVSVVRGERVRRTSVFVWLEHRARVLWVQRPATGVWAGLWTLPEFEGFDALAAASAGWPGQGEPLPDIVHQLTHFEWTLKPRRWVLPEAMTTGEVEALVHALVTPWHPTAQAHRWLGHQAALGVALPTPWRKLVSARVV